tara:strand:+ start:434 stop:1744 length:1311 start_codon:yes stop_codon:yes gene_type:complete
MSEQTPKANQTLYTDENITTFLDETIRESYTDKAWDLEKSTPFGSLKDMIRQFHSAKRTDGKIVITAQVLRIEENVKSLYQIRNPDDADSNIQLIRYRVISDRRHQWLPEPKSNLGDKNNKIINIHPLAKYELAKGEAVSTLKAGDLVEVLFKDNKTPYSSYFESASVIKKVGGLDNIGDSIINRCSNIKLPPLPEDSNPNNIINDPCLIVGNVSGAGLDVKQQAAAAAKKSKKLVFPRFVVATGEVITSQFGKLRTYQNRRGEVVRRVHAGTDYDLSMNAQILAAFDGKVIKSQFNEGGYGNYIVLEHTKYSMTPDDPPTVFYTLYGHLGTNNDGGRSRSVPVGAEVKRGHQIGLGGNSGLSISSNGGDGSHLHFEYVLGNENGGFTLGAQNFKYRKDPVTEFFRRGFYLDVAAERQERGRKAMSEAAKARGRMR